MLLNAWGIALTLLSLSVVTFIIIAARTALRVIRHWNPSSDSNRQISLENEIWLSSTLVEYSLVIQCISLILYVLAADAFCKVIIGAMCATGTLLANPYGMPGLSLKLAGVFIYGTWIVIHKLDISVADYPLVRLKYYFFFLILPVLATDITLQTLFLINLSPEIITSCCGVVFGEEKNISSNLLESFETGPFLAVYYGLSACLIALGIAVIKKDQAHLNILYAVCWLLFFIIALAGITSVFSSYIYAMPYHHCPFCILKTEYNHYGFLLYGSLIPATLFGLSVFTASTLSRFPGLRENGRRFQILFVRLSLALLLIFIVSSSFHFFVYRFLGGEV